MTLRKEADGTLTGDGFSLTLAEHAHAVSLYLDENLETMQFSDQMNMVASAIGVSLGWTVTQAQVAKVNNVDFRELCMRSLARAYVHHRWPMPLELVLGTISAVSQTSDGAKS